MPEAAVTAPETETDATLIAADTAGPSVEPALVEDDLLVEDVSIDGMCGVY